VAEVIDTVSVKEREVQDRQGRWYSLRVRPYKTLDNKIDGAVLVLVDVDLLRRARDYAENIVSTVREPLLVLDADLRVRAASRAFFETFQVGREETEGRLLYDLGNGQWDIAELRRLLGEILPRDNALEDSVVEHDFVGIGRKVMVLNARRVVGQIDQSPLILLAIEDATSRKQLEEALKARVGELAAADRSKNEFLAMLAHELRNPLSPIQNAARILRSSDAGSTANERALDMIDRQIFNMARIVDDLLDISRISRGTIELRMETVELSTVLKQAADSLRGHIGPSQEIVTSLPAESIYVRGDPVRLEQVFDNLLNNASKFTRRPGRIWLTAETSRGGRSLGGGRGAGTRRRDRHRPGKVAARLRALHAGGSLARARGGRIGHRSDGGQELGGCAPRSSRSP
jgi:two-component system CheB/CheR fusion protein